MDPDAGIIDPDDELFTLGERCAEAYMKSDALQYQAMQLLVEFHHRDGWRDTGFSSTAEWLAWRIGIRAGAARERLRTALALEELPQISEAMEQGALSFTKVRALTRVATADNESTLLELAQAGSAANLERLVRGWNALDRRSELTAEQMRHRTRRFSAFVDVDGMVVVRGRLDPEVGALLMRAVEAANDALFRKESREGRDAGHPTGSRSAGEGPDGEGPDGEGPAGHAPPTVDERHTELEERTPEQRRADAIGLIAERALAAGFGGASGGGGSEDGAGSEEGAGSEAGGGAESGSDLKAEAGYVGEAPFVAESTSRAPRAAPISGSRAERYQVMLHVEEATLKEFGEPGQSELEDGTRVSAETSRRISCDCGVVRIGHGPDGQVMKAGRRTRTIPPALRRALEARDRGCRFPGCGLRFTEAHHIVHWADGGETSLRNTVLLCRTHHRAVHEGRVQVCMDVGGQVAFFTPKGKVLFDAPKTRFLDGMEPVLESVLESAEEPEMESALEPELEWTTEWEPGSEPVQEWTTERESGSDRNGSRRPQPIPRYASRPPHLSGAAKWTRDRDIPYGIEARAWEALDSE
jgi:hypothetical protein